ncbi:carbohydrate ABC transporter permease [Candidatus Nomurabacteria bacterium]|nr:carbohydrate ABC transporter permease [Candidatus Nomurabacteria bacterium]
MKEFIHKMISKIKHAGLGRILWVIFRTGMLLGVCYVILYPLFVKLSVAFMDKSDMYDMTVKWIPKNFTLDNFKRIFRLIDYEKYLFTQLFVTGLSVLLQLITTSFAAYSFSRFDFRFKNTIFFVVLLTLIIPQQTYMVTSYVQFRYFDFFGLGQLWGMAGSSTINTPIPVLLMSLGGVAPRCGLYIYVLRQFFKNLPVEIEEAAFVDGAGVLSTFWRVMLPNSITALTTIVVFSFVWSWNDLYTATTYMPAMKLFPLLLNNLTSSITTTLGRSMVDTIEISMITNAGVLMILLPIILFFMLAQRLFIEGIERTGLTG